MVPNPELASSDCMQSRDREINFFMLIARALGATAESAVYQYYILTVSVLIEVKSTR